MDIEGTVVEMGDLDWLSTPGLRIESGDQIIDVLGLTRDQIKALPNVMFKRVRISVEPTP